MALLLAGDDLARRLDEETAARAKRLREAGRPVKLAAVQVGSPPASRMYVRRQRECAAGLGIEYRLEELPADSGESDVAEALARLNEDPSVTGIILQMPLPEGVDGRRVQGLIAPEKDVEGVHPANLGRLVAGEPWVVPPTAAAAVALAEASGMSFAGAEAVVVGHSEIVGKPVALLLLHSRDAAATTTVCHIATRDLASHTRRADLLVVAVGKPGLVRGDMVKEGAVVIDVGINRVPVLDERGNPVLREDGRPKMRTVGDVAFEEVEPKVRAITPVPGGVGRLTVSMLMRNACICAEGLR